MSLSADLCAGAIAKIREREQQHNSVNQSSCDEMSLSSTETSGSNEVRSVRSKAGKWGKRLLERSKIHSGGEARPLDRNERERKRVRILNTTFATLRRQLPVVLPSLPRDLPQALLPSNTPAVTTRSVTAGIVAATTTRSSTTIFRHTRKLSKVYTAYTLDFSIVEVYMKIRNNNKNGKNKTVACSD